METPWEPRIARARELAPSSAAAREILAFYGDLAEYQRGVYVSALRRVVSADVPFAQALDLDAAATSAALFLRWLAEVPSAPAALREAAASCPTEPAEWALQLREAVSRPETLGLHPWVADEPDPFLVRSLLQPYAEAVAVHRRDGRGMVVDAHGAAAAQCPICGGAPRVGVLREDGQGARRTLLCGCCHSEWPFPRLTCRACGETRFEALPVYTAEAFAHLRIEACDTCRRYLKTVDLTVDGLAVPPVDDIASVPLDLWALDRGYEGGTG